MHELPLLLYLIMQLKKNEIFYLIKNVKAEDTYTDTEDKEKDLHIVVHFPNAHTNQFWDRPNLGAGNSIWVFHMAGEDPTLALVPAAVACVHQQNAGLEAEVRLDLTHSDMGGRYPKQWLNPMQHNTCLAKSFLIQKRCFLKVPRIKKKIHTHTHSKLKCYLILRIQSKRRVS